jgi:hypothetical protein
MDQRIGAFLADVLALADENPDAIREGVRVALADCEAIFRAQDEQTHQGPSRSRLPRVVPHSRGRGAAATQGNAHAGTLEAGASIIDRQGALN